jgi:tetratricopeptide (TPR) repeat protein
MKKPADYRASIMVGAVLTCAAVAAYAGIWHADFIDLDDRLYVTANHHIKEGLTPATLTWAFTNFEASNWHPLTWLSLAFDSQLFGLDARIFHVTNIVLHILTAILLFAWCTRATGSLWPSGFVAGLFALHPLHVESVAWIAERKDVLSALLWVLTMWAYLYYARQPTAIRYALLLCVFAIGLMAKPMLVTLPLVLLLLDYWPLGRWPADQILPPRPLVREKLPLLALALLTSYLTLAAQHLAVVHAERLTPAIRLANAVLSYAAYLLKMVWPFNLALFYPYPRPETDFWLHSVLALGALAAITLWACKNRTSRPWLFVGWLWYLVTLVPVIGIVQVGSQGMADRYTYIPLIGPSIMIAFGLGELVLARPHLCSAVFVTASLALIGCIGLTYRQVGFWQDSLTLWQHTLDVTTDNWFAEGSAGHAFVNSSQESEGRRHLLRSLQLRPDFWQARQYLGQLAARHQDYAEAINQFRLASQNAPSEANIHKDLGMAYLESDKPDLAEREFAAAYHLNPDLEGLHADWAQALSKLRRFSEAETHFHLALKRDGESADLLANYGLNLKQQGRLAEAAEQYSRALGLDPRHVQALNNYAVLLAQQGKLDQAETYLYCKRLSSSTLAALFIGWLWPRPWKKPADPRRRAFNTRRLSALPANVLEADHFSLSLLASGYTSGRSLEAKGTGESKSSSMSSCRSFRPFCAFGAPASSGPSCTVNLQLAMCSWSLGSKAARRTRCPLTRVPLVLPKSRRSNSPSVLTITQ